LTVWSHREEKPYLKINLGSRAVFAGFVHAPLGKVFAERLASIRRDVRALRVGESESVARNNGTICTRANAAKARGGGRAATGVQSPPIEA